MILKNHLESYQRQFSTNAKIKINTSFISPGLWPLGASKFSSFFFFNISGKLSTITIKVFQFNHLSVFGIYLSMFYPSIYQYKSKDIRFQRFPWPRSRRILTLHRLNLKIMLLQSKGQLKDWCIIFFIFLQCSYLIIQGGRG